MSRPLRTARGAGLAIAALLWAGTGLAAPELLDRIVAVVDDQIVLWSELELRTQLEMRERGRDPRFLTDGQRAAERRQVLDTMVDELIVVKKAETDSVQVDPERVDEVLNAEFGRIKSSMDAAELTAMLDRAGLTERQLKTRYRKQIRQQMLYEQLLSQLAYRQFITRRDVDEFRLAHADSLPTKVSISQIQLRVAPADSVLERARERIGRLAQRLAAGEDFADVARQMSEDPGTAAAGGDLGCFAAGSLMPEFESAAQQLRPGQVSDPVLTPFGYHLILLRERREEELCASHILARARVTPADKERVLARLHDLRRRALEGEDFAQLARDESEDAGTARQGGLWQVRARADLPAFVEPFIAGLGLGDVSQPFVVEDDGHIVKINDDYATLEALVREERVTRAMSDLIADYRQQIHVEERLDDEWLWDPRQPDRGHPSSSSPETSPEASPGAGS